MTMRRAATLALCLTLGGSLGIIAFGIFLYLLRLAGLHVSMPFAQACMALAAIVSIVTLLSNPEVRP